MTIHRYSNAVLQQLRDAQPCLCVKRTVKRRLKYFKIHVDHIPVLISSDRLRQRPTGPPRARNLVVPPRKEDVRRRCPRKCDRMPSLMLSNVRSINNKMDEVQHRMSMLSPDTSVLTETWLDEETPDCSVTVSDYYSVRKDRNRFGGGIMFYIKVQINFFLIDSCVISSLESCDTELLPVVFPYLKLLIIGVYHPFWGESDKHEETISIIMDIIEHASNLPYLQLHFFRIIICDDFNDCLLYTSPSPRDGLLSRMPSSA